MENCCRVIYFCPFLSFKHVSLSDCLISVSVSVSPPWSPNPFLYFVLLSFFALDSLSLCLSLICFLSLSYLLSLFFCIFFFLFFFLSLSRWDDGDWVSQWINADRQGQDSSLVACWARCPAWCSIVGSILLLFPVEGIFPLELSWVLTPFLKKSFRWDYKLRSSLCTHAFHGTDSKGPDIHVLDGWMKATKPHQACTIQEDGMWLPIWLD